MDKAINYAKRYTDVFDYVVTAIKLARKSSFFNEETAWVEKGEKNIWCDNEELWWSRDLLAELVGLYLLDEPSKTLDKADGGLCRDSGLAAVNNSNVPLMDKLRKKIIALFKEGIST